MLFSLQRDDGVPLRALFDGRPRRLTGGLPADAAPVRDLFCANA